MTEDIADESKDTGSGFPTARKRRTWWWQRPTVRALRCEAEGAHDYMARSDALENDDTRLPSSDSVHLGGLVLVEAFTPSTVSSLYTALDRLPMSDWLRPTDWRDQVARSRKSGAGGWQHLGVLRPPGDMVLTTGGHDPDLPNGVRAVWLSLHYVVPSVAVVVAVFTLDEDVGDLSPLLRQDYDTVAYDTQIRVYGPMGLLRARIPWSRPARHGQSSKISPPADRKRRRCEEIIGRHEDGCLRWFEKRFPGRFTRGDSEQRPILRVILTEESVPFADRRRTLDPVGLDYNRDVWRVAGDNSVWFLALGRSPNDDVKHRRRAIFAARRRDAARERDEDSVESNWYLTQRLADQAPLIAIYTLLTLIGHYAKGLATLRDRAGSGRWFRRPVTEARKLDEYLIRDGLDVATVAADIRASTADDEAALSGRHMPVYVQDAPRRPEADVQEPTRLSEALRRRLRERAAQLNLDTEATTKNIQASAELRQAIANTRLQRVVFAVSTLALIVAVISVVVTAGGWS